eukprot:CAMPEP_0114576568 /NCGR_PEP_ID=MMETSP0125-20121206/1309_1 /TAXON_ID=485358 ORGANISM="Aristerostoma sp., Strain ATCC 50986" /NCGR_SAMPLE_ID=MMETSP0125 /ASSEMBLY_ACC=CAM_ASM_000245 /LENGTH=55 /DNA_ID=CAMNT_0001765171 /DNA_START=3194 /DNA_END=3361 /DNA_ORIENTATION=+
MPGADMDRAQHMDGNFRALKSKGGRRKSKKGIMRDKMKADEIEECEEKETCKFKE